MRSKCALSNPRRAGAAGSPDRDDRRAPRSLRRSDRLGRGVPVKRRKVSPKTDAAAPGDRESGAPGQGIPNRRSHFGAGRRLRTVDRREAGRAHATDGGAGGGAPPHEALVRGRLPKASAARSPHSRVRFRRLRRRGVAVESREEHSLPTCAAQNEARHLRCTAARENCGLRCEAVSAWHYLLGESVGSAASKRSASSGRGFCLSIRASKRGARSSAPPRVLSPQTEKRTSPGGSRLSRRGR